MASHRPWAIALACIYAAASACALTRGLDHTYFILFAIGAVSAAYVAIAK